MIIPKHYWSVKILPEEKMMIEESGIARNNNGNSLGMITKSKSKGPIDHIYGLAGEFAVSLVTGFKISRITGSTKAELNEGDLGGFIEVKTRKDSNLKFCDMCVNSDQLKDDRIFVLCLGADWPNFIHVAGWEFGKTIRLNGRKDKAAVGHDIYFYDRNLLRPISEIFDYIRN